MGLHRRAPGLYRVRLSRGRPSARRSGRLGRLDRGLSRVRLVVSGAPGLGRLAGGGLPDDAAGSGQGEDRPCGTFAQRQAGSARRRGRRAYRRHHRLEWQQRRKRPVALHDRALRQREHRAAHRRAAALVPSAAALLRRSRRQAADRSEHAAGTRRAARSDDVLRLRGVGGQPIRLRAGLSIGAPRLSIPRTRSEYLAEPSGGRARDHGRQRRGFHGLPRCGLRPPATCQGRDLGERVHLRRVEDAVGRDHHSRVVSGRHVSGG